jgi:serine/threonine protein phosphatase 1
MTWRDRLFGGAKVKAAIPPGHRVYAVGDIHGRLDLLKTLWKKIRADEGSTSLHKTIIFLGDYVDRGPDSKGVIDFLLDVGRSETDLVCLRGNHDQSVLDFVRDASHYRAWRRFGAAATLSSYGVVPPRFEDAAALEEARIDFISRCPVTHLQFLEALPFFHELGGYYFAHAGVRPGVSLEQQEPADLLWIREEFLFSNKEFGKTVVHGHSPTENPVRRINRIGIDTGAYATGRLTAAVLEGSTCRFLAT